MPVENIPTKKGYRAYRWGNEGTVYEYKVGNEKAREEAKEKALRQGRAIEANRGRK